MKGCMVCAGDVKDVSIICEPCYQTEIKEAEAESRDFAARIADLEENGLFIDPFDRVLDILRKTWLPNYARQHRAVIW